VGVDIGWVSPFGRDGFQGVGHIAARIVSCQILAQLPDHAEAVGAAAWGKVRKTQLIAVRDLAGHAGGFAVLVDKKSVEVTQELGLTLVISA
jgi:hypothetical protein